MLTVRAVVTMLAVAAAACGSVNENTTDGAPAPARPDAGDGGGEMADAAPRPDSGPELAGLATSAPAELTPAFSPDVTSYALQVPLLVQEIAVTPTAGAGVAITVDGTAVAPGEAAAPIALAEGQTSVEIVATDGDFDTSYEIDITRAGHLGKAACQMAYPPGLGDELGAPIDADGALVAAGVRRDDSAATQVNGDRTDDTASSAGSAYVYRRENAAWVEEAYLKASNADPDDVFGSGVAVSGDTVVIGAPFEDSAATGVDGDATDDSLDGSGAVYVFRRTDGAWEQEAYLKASNAGDGDGFGDNLALDGDTLVVGASSERSAATGVNGNETDDSLFRAGAAYVFRRSGTTWQQEAYLKASNTGAGDFFGFAVDVSGETVVVGAHGEASSSRIINSNPGDDSADRAGAAYVFTRSLDGAWSQQAYLKAPNAEAGDEFGRVLSLEGDVLAVTAYDEDGANNLTSESGAVFVFGRDGSTWSHRATLRASNAGEGDHFGQNLDLHGEFLAVSTLFEDSPGNGIDSDDTGDGADSSGAVYLFRDAGSGFEQVHYIKMPLSDAGDRFGADVALTRDTLAVGAYGEDSAAAGIDGDEADNALEDSGAVFTYH